MACQHAVSCSGGRAYLRQDALQNLADGHDLADGRDGDHVLEITATVLKGGVHIA